MNEHGHTDGRTNYGAPVCVSFCVVGFGRKRVFVHSVERSIHFIAHCADKRVQFGFIGIRASFGFVNNSD